MQLNARISSAGKFSNCGKVVLVIYVCFGILYIAASPPEASLIKRHTKVLNTHEEKRNIEQTRTSTILPNTHLSNVVKQKLFEFGSIYLGCC